MRMAARDAHIRAFVQHWAVHGVREMQSDCQDWVAGLVAPLHIAASQRLSFKKLSQDVLPRKILGAPGSATGAVLASLLACSKAF